MMCFTPPHKPSFMRVLVVGYVDMVNHALHALQGDVKKLTDDISALQPTLFVAVPRVLERIQSGIQAKLKAKPWIVRTIVGLAYSWKLSKLKAGVPLNRVSHTAPVLRLGGERGIQMQSEQVAGNMLTVAMS